MTVSHLQEEASREMADGKQSHRERINYQTCIRCKAIFHYSGFGHRFCPRCKEKDEKEFEKVKEYIYKHGTATAAEVSEFTGVSLSTIELYLREGRLIIPENSPIFIKCEKCGEDIRSGRVCMDCATVLSAAMKRDMNFDEYQIGEKPRIKNEGKMRFFTRE